LFLDTRDPSPPLAHPNAFCLNKEMKLLLEHQDSVLAQNEVLRLALIRELRTLSHLHLRRCKIWVYGSLTQPGRFRLESDIDLALDQEPEGLSIYGVSALLSENLGRSVDVVLLNETRLKNKILENGISWIA
jgi:predicted nucleotidyltransferase